VSDTDEQPQTAPPAGEHIHMPGSSIQPLLLAVGLTLALVGVTLSWVLTIIGGVLSIWVVIRWIGDTRRDIAELPVDHD
jgi:tetrahydromethanopterin S-methyltransferase subunit C